MPPLAFLFVTLFAAGCVRLPTHRGQPEDGRDARYVPASGLAEVREQKGVQVLTSIPLRHITARVAEERLRKVMPKDVLIGVTGRGDSILLQGEADKVYTAAEVLKKIDVEKENRDDVELDRPDPGEGLQETLRRFLDEELRRERSGKAGTKK